MTRAYTGHRGPIIAPEVRAEILRTMDHERIADQARRLGVSATAIQKIRRVDGEPATRTLRAEIIHLLEMNGPYADAEALLHDIRLADTHRRWSGIDLHSLQHQLGSMNRIAMIAYRRRRVGSINRLTDIRVRPVRRTNGAPPTAATVAPPAEEPTETAAEPAPVSGSPDDAWPVLTALRDRRDGAVAARMHADALVAAAEVLAPIDAVESERLLARAAHVSVDDLTAAEAEYLRFADEHDGGDA